jgi:glycosyltransferase involved in cell wall biosynthesis
MGGARSHLLGLVPELARLAAPGDTFLLLAQPDLLADLPPLPPGWQTRLDRPMRQAQRLLWEQRALPRLAAEFGADVLLSFGSFVPLRGACPTVLEAGNALPFTRAYWLRLRQEAPLRVRAQELARWALLRASLRAARRVLAPTRAMRQDVVSLLPELAERVDVAPWGVAEVFRHARWSDPGTDVALGVSKHGINKEFDVLVASLVHPALRGLRLRLTGTPDESRWARRTLAAALQLGVSERVCFLGDVPNAQLPARLAEARLLVFPTWCESFGLPLAEALAMGAPAVAADIPACREVGGEAARYYQPGDPASLADTIGSLLANPAAARELGQRASANAAERFSWAANARLVLGTLKRALA